MLDQITWEELYYEIESIEGASLFAKDKWGVVFQFTKNGEDFHAHFKTYEYRGAFYKRFLKFLVKKQPWASGNGFSWVVIRQVEEKSWKIIIED